MCCSTSSEVICGSTAKERNSGGSSPSLFCGQRQSGAVGGVPETQSRPPPPPAQLLTAAQNGGRDPSPRRQRLSALPPRPRPSLATSRHVTRSAGRPASPAPSSSRPASGDTPPTPTLAPPPHRAPPPHLDSHAHHLALVFHCGPAPRAGPAPRGRHDGGGARLRAGAERRRGGCRTAAAPLPGKGVGGKVLRHRADVTPRPPSVEGAGRAEGSGAAPRSSPSCGWPRRRRRQQHPGQRAEVTSLGGTAADGPRQRARRRDVMAPPHPTPPFLNRPNDASGSLSHRVY